MALQITDTILRMAEQAMNAGDVAGTWSLLLFVDEIEQRIGFRVEQRGRGRLGNEEK
ncbi:MAG: hypothetical protein P8171_26080 [Candidatus Thiodiazotropha sp.]|jgi:hypothetical protein